MKTILLTFLSFFSLSFLLAAPTTPTSGGVSRNINQHYLKAASADGTMIMLEDDSRWSVSPTGHAATWTIVDELRVEPNPNPVVQDQAAYAFKILNLTKNDSLVAYVYRPANYTNPNTYLIRFIDRAKGIIQIDHLQEPYKRSAWQVAEADIPKIQEWQLDNTIMVGDPAPVSFLKTIFKNTQAGEKNILINLPGNTFVNVEHIY